MPLKEMTSPILDDSPTRRKCLHVALACCWLLMFVTFSVPGRDQPGLASLDLVALAKVATRATCLGLLACLLYILRNVPQSKSVFRCMFPLALYVGLAIVSTLWSPLVSITLGQAASLTVLFMLALTLGMLWRSSRDTSTILFNIALALLAISTVLLLARLLVPSLGSASRAGSGMFHATSAGATASLGIIVLVASRFLWNWRWSQWLLPGVLLHAVVLLLAVNRVSLFLTIVLVPCILLFYSNRQLALAAVVALCIAATGYIALDPGLQYMDSVLGTASVYANRGQVTKDLAELSGRQEMWQTIWESCQQSIWIGHGYSVCSPTGELFVWFEWSNWTAHNVALQCLMSTGLVGLVLLLWALVRIGYQWVRNYYRGRLSRELTVFLVVIVCWNVVWGIFNSSFLGPVSPQSVTFFVLIGLAVGAISACGTPAIGALASENNSVPQALRA